MTTVRDLITGAARLLGVIQKGEALAADEAADGFSALNDMLGTWSNESLLIFSRTVEEFTLQPNVAAYPIGPGLTFDTVRPTVIHEAYVRYQGFDQELWIISDEEYNGIYDKSTPSIYPTRLSFDNAYPVGTIRVNPVPDRASTLILSSEKPITEFASLDSEILLPPGWARALRYNLAIEMAPEYDVMPSQLVLLGAQNAKGQLKITALRSQPETVKQRSGRYNIYTDQVE
ncbi:hypothetical protein J0X19_11780 [Hymenobacter sp. BT186]|uniref:Uncharacterized protein n=1 Tax=Hymenobacter telluris TaxID=2816474 RepID=A0A939EXW4_9BACT|nr:hypothetical protein [Hymenobacter telluris]MBO0358627.1 hypothetical protein [Hymenobacter telluris]MBW3374653.1 hypothetical protein [Hymenobacter norwichensis]